MLGVWKSLENADLRLVNNSDGLAWLWQNRHTLGLKLDTLLLRLLLSDIVGLNSLDEGLVASTLSNVLDSDVNSLAKLVTTMSFGDFNTNGRLGDVENNAGPSMVELIRHTLVN